MSPWSAPRLDPFRAKLGDYARKSLAEAEALAARLHSEDVSPEHWLVTLLGDEECAATRVVLHAFADPETIAVEVMALCSGTMVVGSVRTLPFSVLGVRVVESARAEAAEQGRALVQPVDLWRCALASLPHEVKARLSTLHSARMEPPGSRLTAPGESAVQADGALFRSFSAGALRTLGASCRAADSLGRAAIGPVHVMLGALETDEDLRGQTLLSAGRLRMALSGLDADDTPLPQRELGADARLLDLLAGLPEGAGTLDVLAWTLARGSAELGALLRRQKVTPALLESCRSSFDDP